MNTNTSPLGGPKGGRLLDNPDPRAEFFVEKDSTVTITFYDDALKPVAASEQTVTVIAETEGVKTKVEFEKKGDVLVSKGALPEGHALNWLCSLNRPPMLSPSISVLCMKIMCAAFASGPSTRAFAGTKNGQFRVEYPKGGQDLL